MTRPLDSLAIYGGRPAFAAPLHVGRPNIGDRARLLERINDLLDRRWLTNDGPFVREFERRIAERAGVGHCVALCNATAALEILFRALGVAGEVILPSFTFVATAHALLWQGITPVFCDIDRRTHNLDPDRVAALITPRTTAILGVHVWGRACAVQALAEVARQHNLELLFDAAHAFACTHQGRPIGGFGRAEVFSFHATKFFNTFEGGAVVTNDGELAARLRMMRNFGFAGYDQVVEIGLNGKMSEVAAAMGLTGLESLEEFIAVNQRNYRHYRQGLQNLPGVRLIEYPGTEKYNYQYVVLEIDEGLTGLSRDRLVEVLHAENVLARRYFYPGCHRMEPYRSRYPQAGALLPETERLSECVLALPTGTAVGPEAIGEICGLVRLVAANGRALTENWPARPEARQA